MLNIKLLVIGGSTQGELLNPTSKRTIYKNFIGLHTDYIGILSPIVKNQIEKKHGVRRNFLGVIPNSCMTLVCCSLWHHKSECIRCLGSCRIVRIDRNTRAEGTKDC